jgi:hypothetical protein
MQPDSLYAQGFMGIRGSLCVILLPRFRRLHCDGYCDNSPYIPGGRAATVVLYCDVSIITI